MNTAAFFSAVAACAFTGSLIAQGQTDDPITRPGYYRGTMTMTSPEFDGEKAPVKSVFPVAARVGESSDFPGKLYITIRLRPVADINAPLRDFVVKWTDPTSSYTLFQRVSESSLSGNGCEVKESRNKVVITTAFFALPTEGPVVSADVRITLTRAGD
jgi:hypothetical protein